MRPLPACPSPQVGTHLVHSKSPSFLVSSQSRPEVASDGGTPFGAILHDAAGLLAEYAVDRPGLPHAARRGDVDLHAPRRKAAAEATALDSSARHAAQLAPPSLGGLALSDGRAGPVQVETRIRSSLEDLLPELVRRVAWSGDGRRGTVRLELGAGELAGATLLVHADDGRVRLQLSVPPGVSARGWGERIAERLGARGLVVDGVEVD
jgi:hypothetical protein